MKRFDQINVIPFIDIMLVLLAIVLTTASFISTGHLHIRLPETEAATAQQLDDPLEIAIDADQLLYLDGEATTLDGLKETIDQTDPQRNISLRVDTGVTFGTFVPVMDALKARGMEKLSIITRNTQ
ncbi:MAG: biopolymer transporter ExbD [Gammaproteobacteria bacterium]|jgi:biopolymer transport protein ExbD